LKDGVNFLNTAEEKYSNEPEGKKRKFKMPHVLVLMVLIMLFAVVLTYIVPAGDFEYTEDGTIISGTYHTTEQTPVNPIQAMNLIMEAGIQSAPIVILALFVGGFLGGIMQLDSVGNVISYFVNRFEKSAPIFLVVSVFTLMGIIGFFMGGDTTIVFVMVGVILAKKLRLDPIFALAVTFLPLFLTFAVGPTGMADQGQIISGIPLYTGYGMRIVISIIFMIITIFYVIRYMKKVQKNFSNSLMHDQVWWSGDDENESNQLATVAKLGWQDVAVLAIVILAPIVLAFGNTVLGWAQTYGNSTMITTFFIAFLLCFLIKRKSVNDMVSSFLKGANEMMVVMVAIVLATAVSVILSEGNILNTVVNYMTGFMSDFPLGISAIFIAIIAALLSFLIPSGSGMMALMFPILQPIADTMGMTPQVLLTSLTFGGGLINFVLPTLGATVGAIAIAKANFGAWVKFMIPLLVIWFVVGSVILYFLASIGWVGY